LNWVHDLIVIVASLLAVLFIYLILYCASLVTLKTIIEQWNVTAVAFRPIVNSAMLVIYLTSPFNAYEALMLHADLFQYFALSVGLPTAILAVILVFVLIWCWVGIVDCESAGGLFLIHSFALALATSYITSLIIWLTLGKPSIGTSIYTEYMLAATVYVAVVSTWDLPKRLMASKNPFTRMLITTAIATNSIPALYAIYLAIVLLFKPSIPHIVGLIFTAVLLAIYHKHATKPHSKAT